MEVNAFNTTYIIFVTHNKSVHKYSIISLSNNYYFSSIIMSKKVQKFSLKFKRRAGADLKFGSNTDMI